MKLFPGEGRGPGAAGFVRSVGESWLFVHHGQRQERHDLHRRNQRSRETRLGASQRRGRWFQSGIRMGLLNVIECFEPYQPLTPAARAADKGMEEGVEGKADRGKQS